MFVVLRYRSARCGAVQYGVRLWVVRCGTVHGGAVQCGAVGSDPVLSGLVRVTPEIHGFDAARVGQVP